MVHHGIFLVIAVLAFSSASSKKFGGFRLKSFTSKLPTFRFPLTGLFSSVADENGRDLIVGGGGDGIRGGAGGGGVGSGDKNANFGANDDSIGNTKQAGLILFLTSLLDSYTGLLEKYPFPTKMVTSAFIGALGDYLVQTYEGRKSKKALDFRRILVFATVCGIYIAPVIHVWFEYLNKMPFLLNLGKYSKAFAMMFVDQSVGATVITLGFFFAFEAAQALYPPYTGKNFIEAGWNSVKSNLGVTMIANWTCWPSKFILLYCAVFYFA